MTAYRIICFVALLCVAGPVPAQAAGDPPVADRNIQTQKAATLVRQGAPIIDVRTPEELLETGYIEGATNIPHTELDRIEALIGERKDRAVVLYCRSGRRVALVINALRDRGFESLVNAGGLVDFKAALSAP